MFTKPRLTAVAIATVLAITAVCLFASVTPIPPTPTQWVTDTAGFLSPQTVDSLNQRLRAYEQQSGHQILVYIGKTTGDDPIEDWAVHAFEKWKPGRKGLDDGLLLLIMAQDRRLKIEVGYGLEGQVTDLLAGRVINDVIVPRIRAGQQDAAVTAGIDAIVGIISGQGLPAPPQGQRSGRRQPQPLTLGQLILFGIIGIVLLIVFITNPSLAIWLLMSIMSGGGGRSRDDGWGGGGGGFSGGGGRSGGGGASGSW